MALSTAAVHKEKAINILVVDDSKSMRTVIAHAIHDSGYSCELANDGKMALEIAQNQSFDLVLTDINMPEMDGFTLIQELRKLKNYKHIPILVLTTEWSDDMKQKGREVNATGWLIKPFDPVKLINTIEKVTL